jgi:hypothetical protein
MDVFFAIAVLGEETLALVVHVERRGRHGEFAKWYQVSSLPRFFLV